MDNQIIQTGMSPEHMFTFGVVLSLLTACLEHYDGWCGSLTGKEIIMVPEEAQQLATQYCNTVTYTVQSFQQVAKPPHSQQFTSHKPLIM
jgi:hypothetical protein